jgi:3-methyladenine DNA glycosylase AlkD
MIEDIQKALRNMTDPEIAAHSLRFFKTWKGQYGEGDVFLGIRVPDLRKLARSFKGISQDVCAGLLASPYHEERMVALIVLVDQFQKAGPKDQESIYHLYMDNTRYVNNWDLVDVSAPAIVGGYFLDKDPRPLVDLAKSSCLWERRISMVATWAFIRRGQLDLTFRIAEILIGDPEDLIHKAAGWMLREAGKRDLSALEGFLKRHYPVMPRTMLRYAIEKLDDERRRAYLEGWI